MKTCARIAVAASAVLSIAACSSGSQATPGSSASSASAVPVTAASASSPSARASAAPETAAGARVAASRFFGLYTASQYAEAWTLLPPSTRRSISQETWTAVHQACPSASAGLAFKITDVTVTGNTAVVTYTLAGAASALGTATQAFTYSQGQWWLVLSDPGMYEHGSVKKDIAAAKAQGQCSGS